MDMYKYIYINLLTPILPDTLTSRDIFSLYIDIQAYIQEPAVWELIKTMELI